MDPADPIHSPMNPQEAHAFFHDDENVTRRFPPRLFESRCCHDLTLPRLHPLLTHKTLHSLSTHTIPIPLSMFRSFSWIAVIYSIPVMFLSSPLPFHFSLPIPWVLSRYARDIALTIFMSSYLENNGYQPFSGV